MKKVKDLTGQRFGKLVVVSLMPRQLNEPTIWLCHCEDGNECKVTSGHLLSGHTKSCGCLKNIIGVKKRIAAEQDGKRYGEISGRYWSAVKQSARIRNIEFQISIEYAWKTFLKQDGKCAISGQHLTFAKSSQPKDMKLQTASIDRINSTKGYAEGNIQWTHKIVNIAKKDRSDIEFIEMCHIISDYNRNRKIIS